MKIKSDITYNDLKSYKKELEEEFFDSIAFKLYVEDITINANLKFIETKQNTAYDRKKKFQIFIRGLANTENEKEAIKKLINISSTKPVLIAGLLFFKERQSKIENEDNSILYNIRFIQY